MRKLLLVLSVCLLSARPIFAASDFTYSIPDGWVDLTDPFAETRGIPQFVVQEARSGKYRLYAIDPRAVTAQGAPVSLNVIEQAGTDSVSLIKLKVTAEQMSQQMEAAGITMILQDTQVQKLKGADIGVITSLLKTSRGDLQLMQYMIPGKTQLAVLTYGCPPDALEHYRQIFQHSAMSTTGAYQRGFDFGRVLFMGFLGALAGAVIALVAYLATKKKKPAPIAAARPVSGGTPIMWDCATCKRRVPMRFDVCRCGAARPA